VSASAVVRQTLAFASHNAPNRPTLKRYIVGDELTWLFARILADDGKSGSVLWLSSVTIATELGAGVPI
jgi:hypothetical protein